MPFLHPESHPFYFPSPSPLLSCILCPLPHPPTYLSPSPMPSCFTPPPPHPQKLSGGCELTVVLQDFNAGHSSELSIQVGQTVELLERPSERPGWCLVRTTERSPPQEGLVPSSALCISHSRSSVEMDCFFPLVKGKEKAGRRGWMRTRGRQRCGPLVRRASWHSLASGTCFDLWGFFGTHL